MKKIYLTVLSIITVFCILIGTWRNLFARHDVSYDEAEEYEWSEEEEMYPEENYVRLSGEDIREIDLSFTAGSVWITGGEEFAMSMDPEDIIWSVENGTLKIRETEDAKTEYTGRGDEFPEERILTLLIPEDMYLENIDAVLNAGTLECDNFTAQKAKFHCDAGSVMVSNVIFEQNADISVSMGDINLQDIIFNKMTVTEDMGNVFLYSQRDLTEYSKSCSVSLGEMHINGQSFGKTFSTDGDDGRLILTNKMGNVDINW